MRQGGESENQACFWEILGGARDGAWLVQDWLCVQSRVLDGLPIEERQSFDEAVALICTRKEVKTYNVKHQLDMRLPVYRAIATYSAAAPIISVVRILEADLAGDLQPYLLLSIAARVMITKNLWVQTGIVNGSMGTIRGIVMGEQPQGLPAFEVKGRQFSGRRRQSEAVGGSQKQSEAGRQLEARRQLEAVGGRRSVWLRGWGREMWAGEKARKRESKQESEKAGYAAQVDDSLRALAD
ncbi:hypothetical protein BGX38DRAFT_1279112 [Terfezia claveryi]|nr:hypothetical protein BGX38DRAFT_1279112 [Terfezia claveryi]